MSVFLLDKKYVSLFFYSTIKLFVKMTAYVTTKLICSSLFGYMTVVVWYIFVVCLQWKQLLIPLLLQICDYVIRYFVASTISVLTTKIYFLQVFFTIPLPLPLHITAEP